MLSLEAKVGEGGVWPGWEASHIRIFAGNLDIIVMQDQGHVELISCIYLSHQLE